METNNFEDLFNELKKSREELDAKIASGELIIPPDDQYWNTLQYCSIAKYFGIPPKDLYESYFNKD